MTCRPNILSVRGPSREVERSVTVANLEAADADGGFANAPASQSPTGSGSGIIWYPGRHCRLVFESFFRPKWAMQNSIPLVISHFQMCTELGTPPAVMNMGCRRQIAMHEKHSGHQ